MSTTHYTVMCYTVNYMLHCYIVTRLSYKVFTNFGYTPTRYVTFVIVSF